jgi:hypothetical protein
VDEGKPLHSGHRFDERDLHRVPGSGVLAHGRAVQVDSIKPQLKPPGTKRVETKV